MKASLLSADDLSPLIDKLPPEERIRLAYYALRIKRSVETLAPRVPAVAAPAGLPDMTEFQRGLGVAPYPRSSVLELRAEERG